MSVITWAQFETCNQNPQKSFEDMCRQLFNRRFFNNKASLHSNPNNPGIEIEPKLQEDTGKRISFQAKYFSRSNYKDIENSADQTIKYYHDQIDILYLYCNKNLDNKCDSYKKIEDKLNKSNIILELIDDQIILDQVRADSIISFLYFNQHHLTDAWFSDHIKTSLDNLGPKYNKKFNVRTSTEEFINIFAHNQESIIRINQKKDSAIDDIINNSHEIYSHYDLMNRVCFEINSLTDISSDNIDECLEWVNIINNKFSKELEKIKEEIDNKKTTVNEIKDKIENPEFRSEMQKLKVDRRNLEQDIRKLKYLSEMPSLLEFNEKEKNLLQKKVLILKGDAGVGKSQIFAKTANSVIQSKGHSLLLLGNSFLSNEPLMSQIPKCLEVKFSFDNLLDILEGLGEQGNETIVIFVDAINESGYKEIWKTNLIQLVNKLIKYNHLRLAISIRTGYEQLVLSDGFINKIKNGEFIELFHEGDLEMNQLKQQKSF